MCGIGGIISNQSGQPPERGELRRMLAMMSHRGPDGYGLYIDDRVGLVHSRLSLIDLAGGAQPLSNQDGTLWLSFNGEIFNYIELRRQLIELGSVFSTNGDSEVIVNCYERFGERAWRMLNGQFAFALWDTRRRQLWLVRDRVGIVPLYYSCGPGHVVFASEAKAILAGGRVESRIDPQGLNQAFTTWSAIAPRTMFQNIRQVPPATALRFDELLEPVEHLYWHAQPALRSQDEGSIDDALEAHLGRSVALRLRADVPVGAYVSGGLDSSVVASLASKASGDVETFGIRFEDPRFDETREQRLVATHLGANHHELLCRASDICDALPEVIWHCETPLLRTSPVPLFLLAKQVKAAGIKTVLTGEGADEIMCGYSIFKEDQIRRFWAKYPQSSMRPALLRRIHHYVGEEESRRNSLWQSFFGRGLQETNHPFYSHLIRWRNSAWTLRLLTPEICGALPLESMLTEMETRLPPDWMQWDPTSRAQYIEIEGFMSSYLLSCQGDRVAMAHGIEARYPFLDPDLIDFCFTLKSTDKLIGTRDKLPLRRLAKRCGLPSEITGRRKQPFRAPIVAAMFDRDNVRFEEALSPEHISASGYFDTAAVAQLLARTRARAGDPQGEREEMGLIGVLTLQLLLDAFGPQFQRRIAEAESRLASMRCDVFVDRTGDRRRSSRFEPAFVFNQRVVQA